MSMSSLKTIESIDAKEHKNNGHHADEEAAIERIKQRVLSRRVLEARRLASRLQTAPDGSTVVLRFDRGQRIEHQLLMITFTLLAFTGLLQRYSRLLPVQVTINNLLGGVDTVRVVHHLSAILFIIISIYHVGEILDVWVVKGHLGSMWPRWRDARNLGQTIWFNLGLAKHRPESDRFSIEEKVEYWALIWGGAVMILTGLALWFPILVTRFLPGSSIPISRSIHSWEAVLATLAILVWHTYHVIIKEKNQSIFTGTMTEEEMQETHPLEYRRILAAREFLQKAANEDSKSDSHDK